MDHHPIIHNFRFLVLDDIGQRIIMFEFSASSTHFDTGAVQRLLAINAENYARAMPAPHAHRKSHHHFWHYSCLSRLSTHFLFSLLSRSLSLPSLPTLPGSNLSDEP